MTSIESTVLSLLAKATGRSLDAGSLEKLLLRDLRLDGDDYAMWLIPEIQKQFRIRVPGQRWAQVYTGTDIVEIIREALNQQGSPPETST